MPLGLVLMQALKLWTPDNVSTDVARNMPTNAILLEMDTGGWATVANVLNSYKIDAMMHFAGSIVVPESVVNPSLYYDNNTAKSLGLIQEAVKASVRAFASLLQPPSMHRAALSHWTRHHLKCL
jgi:UDP-glucose 4-epimerase